MPATREWPAACDAWCTDAVGLTVRLFGGGDDADALGRLVVDAYSTDAGYPSDDDYERELADVAGRAERAAVAVAVMDDRVVGCVTYVAEHTDPMAEHDDPEAGAFRMLAVGPAAQGAGAGAALVQWCVARARAGGKLRLVIHSGSWMSSAHRLYERLGFVRRPDLDFAPKPGVDLLGFSLEVPR